MNRLLELWPVTTPRWGAARRKHTVKQWRGRWGAAPREPQGIKNPQKSPSGVKFPGLIALYFQTKPRVESRGSCGPPVLDGRSWNPRGRWLATGQEEAWVRRPTMWRWVGWRHNDRWVGGRRGGSSCRPELWTREKEDERWSSGVGPRQIAHGGGAFMRFLLPV